SRQFSLPRFFYLFLLLFPLTMHAQMITGVWKGKINRQKVEVKIIRTGDSLTGSSYYFESANNYRRYSIKGYFDPTTNDAVWWDDQLLEEKSTRFSISTPGKIPMLSRAAFNCPGGSRMLLDGKSAKKENDLEPTGEVHLNKTGNPEFEDEWDFVIDNYTVGANDPFIIDSIRNISQPPIIASVPVKTIPEEKKTIQPVPPITKTEDPVVLEPVTPKKEPAPVVVAAAPVKPPTIEEKFIARKKVFIKEIPVTGDSVELRFYDNAEVDGDSISLFLNDKLLFEHIRLTGAAYSIKLPVSELNETNELIMVAENLGAIPPNTSYMLAIVGDKRYDAYLSSTEGSSAMIRFIKKSQ
ncbi:MAG: hypothetical protein ABI688_01415, partial [Bacteroidota bacterium]